MITFVTVRKSSTQTHYTLRVSSLFYIQALLVPVGLGEIQTFLNQTPFCRRVDITPHAFVTNKPLQYYSPYII